jgi:phosphoglycolate phosphatase
MSAASLPARLNCDAYLFDIDGTLLNVRDGTHYHAFHHAVRDVFAVDSKIDGVPVHGNTDIGILRAVVRRAGIGDAEFEASLPRVIEQMCSEVEQNAASVRPELCPSIPELLESLSKAGKLLGIASGNLERIGWIKLRAARIADYFSLGSFSDRAELRSTIFQNAIEQVRRKLGDAASVCVVGDTPSDIAAARHIGIPVIAVATGIYTFDELAKDAPDVCLSCCTELLPHLGFPAASNSV